MRRFHLLPTFDHDECRIGVREMTPFSFAIGVWGLVTGVALVNAGLNRSPRSITASSASGYAR